MEIKSKIKILLVDDREDNLFSMQTLLEKDGYQLIKARSGKEALKVLLKEFDFTLILMDVQMPDLNGFDTAALIYERDRLKHIPIIFVTAHDHNDEHTFQGYKAGAVDYIYKPINSDLLRAKVGVFAELYKKNHLLIEHERKLQMVNLELESRVKERTEELINKNKELESINKELKKVNSDLDNFVYSASHDLKAPVSNIEGLVANLFEMLDETASKDEGIQLIFDLLNQSIDRFKNTIADLTEITKIQKNLEEDTAYVDLIETIKDVQITLRDSINASEAKIEIECMGETKLNFSRKNLNSILYNLISNAIKYKSPERKPFIKIKIKNEDEKIFLSVKDNGLGFKSSDKEKIFSMFKRLHNHVEGSGIGLYIVKRILENTGGSIDVESEPDKGSTFNICFANNIEEVKVLQEL